MTLANVLLAIVTLTVAPWNVPKPAAASPLVVAYRLTVRGTPRAEIRLHATGVATGWIAAFCTPTSCSPERVAATLPASGTTSFDFELIRELPGAAPASGATIVSADGARVVLPPQR